MTLRPLMGHMLRCDAVKDMSWNYVFGHANSMHGIAQEAVCSPDPGNASQEISGGEWLHSGIKLVIGDVPGEFP